MSNREKIQRYIKNTNLSPKATDSYCLHSTDLYVFYEEMQRNQFRAICLIFAYGQAKGYRAAKAETGR